MRDAAARCHVARHVLQVSRHLARASHDVRRHSQLVGPQDRARERLAAPDECKKEYIFGSRRDREDGIARAGVSRRKGGKVRARCQEWLMLESLWYRWRAFSYLQCTPVSSWMAAMCRGEIAPRRARVSKRVLPRCECPEPCRFPHGGSGPERPTSTCEPACARRARASAPSRVDSG